MTARCIRIHDLASLLGKSVDDVHASLSRAGVKLETFFTRPAVNMQSLVSRGDAAMLKKLNAAAKRRHFDLERGNWTIAAFPQVLALWDHKRNGDLRPEEVIFVSDKPVWWKCSEASGHVWQGAPRVRFHSQRQPDGIYRVLACPFCTHHRVTKRASLAQKRPDLALEWHPRRNGRLRPEDVPLQSKKEVWWKCAKGHVWQRRVGVRTASSTGCPVCAGTILTRETSLAIKAPNLVSQWHPTKNGGLKPRDISYRTNRKVWWKCPVAPDHEWEASACARVKSSGCPFCVNRRISKDNTLARKFPEIARQWHTTRNGTLTPKDVVATSGREVWWKCKLGPDHEWCCRVLNRTQHNTGCPCCSGHKASVTNSLASNYPSLAKEWNPRRNPGRPLASVVATSSKKAWWRCQKGHEWQDSPMGRTVYHHECPACAGAGTSRARIQRR